MRNIKHSLTILIWIILLVNKQKCDSQHIKTTEKNNYDYNKRLVDDNNNDDDDERPTKFVLDGFDENGGFLKRYNITFNYTTFMFNEYSTLKAIYGFQTGIICSEEDIDKNDNEKKTLLLWHPGSRSSFSSSAKFANLFPMWYISQKKKNEIFCLKLEGVGWDNNAVQKICEGEHPCPDLISLGTTQLSYRYEKGETISLNNYFAKYFKKTGISIESLINKYSYYDYRINNNWLAIPIIADLRPFRFNKTTFDYCIKEGYDLHYPPPHSDYWGTNYYQTWTWEKAFEYAKMIKNCTGYPGFRIYGSKSEDTKFFIQFCQSTGIPFLIEDPDLNIKKCGFRDKNYIKKLEIIKDIFENHYVEQWLFEPLIDQWKASKYPTSYIEQPSFIQDFFYTHHNNIFCNGFILDSSVGRALPDLEYSYVPGTSTFLGGQGIVITTKSKYQDQAFEYLELFLNSTYPFTSLLNISVTPYNNLPGKDCKQEKAQKTKKDYCNSLINTNGTYPHYYIYNNITNIIYLNYESINSEGRVRVNKEKSSNVSSLINKITDKYFQCDNYSSYNNNTITLYGKYDILLPINENKTIIVKSMQNYNEYKDSKKAKLEMCSIFDESLIKAKPMQFPYNTFSEINDFEIKSPVSLLLAHLYYKHNDTEEGTFEQIINECCDIMDYSFVPICKEDNNVKFKFSDCNYSTRLQEIQYLNCKNIDDKNLLPTTKECTYIPYLNINGIVLISMTFISVLTELTFLIIVTIYRNEKTIHISGYKYILMLIISTFILNASISVWVGETTKFKCIFKFWTMIIGINGFVCSYSIRSQIIISIYNNKDMSKKINTKKNIIVFYSSFVILQWILLFIWSFTQKGLIIKQKKLYNIGYYDYNVCSYGNKYILTMIFFIDYVFILISIISVPKGRNVPTQYNFTRNTLINSIILMFLLTLCYCMIILNIESLLAYFITIFLIIFTTLLINILYIGSKLLMIFNMDPEISLIVITNKNESRNVNNQNENEN